MTGDLVCWKCGASLDDEPLPLARTAECAVCNADLHVCRLCEWYDTAVAKACREPVAEDGDRGGQAGELLGGERALLEGRRQDPGELVELLRGEDRALGDRRGKMTKMNNLGFGRARMEFLVPSRGPIGFRGIFLTETPATGPLNTLFPRWAPHAGPTPPRQNRPLLPAPPATPTPSAPPPDASPT